MNKLNGSFLSLYLSLTQSDTHSDTNGSVNEIGLLSSTVARTLVAAAANVRKSLQRARNPLHMCVLETWARGTVSEWSAFPETS